MKRKKITIVGGGATGLAAAFFAAQEGQDVTLLESSPSFGGLLSTFEIAGTRLEHYYHHFFTHDRHLLAMLDALNLRDKLQFYPSSIGVHGIHGIQDFCVPSDLLRYRGFDAFDKLRFVLSSVYLGKFADWRKYEGCSAVEWFSRWAGSNITRNLWEPLLRAKFGDHAHSIPLSWMIGRLSQRMNSRRGTAERLGYLHGSLSVYLEAMLDRLGKMGVRLISSCPTRKIILDGNTLAALETDHGLQTSDAYLFTQPLGSLADDFSEPLPKFSQRLRSIRYLGALCVVLELSKPLSETYWINMTDPACPFTGLIEHTNLVPASDYQGRHIVYLGRYFDPTNDAIAHHDRERIEKDFLAYLATMIPHFSHRDIFQTHFFRSSTAATLSDLHFSSRVPPYLGPLDNMRIANMAHVYPDERSLNNAIRVAKNALAAKLA